jgi:hypothetical protein
MLRRYARYMIASLPTFLVVAVIFLAAALVTWLLFTIIWYVVKRVGRVTGLDEKVDQFLDTDGAGLTGEERIKHVGGYRGGSGGV